MSADFYLWIAAAALVPAPIQAHRLLPRFVTAPAPRRVVRALLIVLGALMGLAAAAVAARGGLTVLAAGLFGWGAVHVPSAVILMLKQRQAQADGDEP